jgi:hypothetical protein
VIVRFLSKFDVLEESSTNDRPGRVIVRFLNKFGTLEESSANDRPGGVTVRTTEDVNDCCRAKCETCKEKSVLRKLKI